MSEKTWRLSMMVAPLVMLLFYFAFYENLSIHARLEASNRREVQQAVGGRLEGYIDELLMLSRAAASLDSIHEQDRSSLHRRLVNLAQDFPFVSNIVFINSRGVVVDSLRGQPGARVPDLRAIKETLDGNAIVSNVTRGFLLKRPLIYAQSPVIGQNGQISGVVAVSVTIDDLESSLAGLTLQDTRVILMDGLGNLIFHSGTPFTAEENKDLPPQLRTFPLNQEQSIFLDGNSYIVYVSPVRNTAWRLALVKQVATIPELAISVTLRNTLILLTALLLAPGMYKYYQIRHKHFLAETRVQKESMERSFILDMLNSTPLAILTVDNNMYVSYANKAWEELTGYNETEVLGLSTLEIENLLRIQALPGQKLTPPKDGEMFACRHVIIRRKNGEKINVVQDNCPFMRGTGREGTVLFFQDVSTMVKYHTLKQTSDTVLEQMLGGVMVVDETGRLTMLNRAAERILNLPGEGVLGRFIPEIFPGTGKEHLLTVRAMETMQKAGPLEVKYQIGGREYWLLVSADVLTDALGNFTGVVTVFHDITELHKQQELDQQREKLAMVGQMAAGMAHELRNPLTSVKGFAQLLSSRLKDTKNQEYLDIIIQEIDRINEIIKDFLLLARPRTPKGEPLDINQLLGQLSILVESQCILMQVTLEKKLTPDLPLIKAEGDQLKQVFLNLTHNALQAMESSPRRVLTLATGREGDYVVISVRDTGQGMSEEVLSRLGTPFFTTKETGTGLGLTVSYRIVENHRGRVEIHSRPGQGTEFRVCFPALTARENVLAGN
ncbi:PAS domain-containing protein [Desulfotomaculum copahuensis]|uniref:histidine kinase n=1 Tax=Desulfotomaculum copahuensis TaxID=1838280 RepID=A0A1B7LHS1_9FIRM|nr:PAS domain-containing protein [Desulfotomaculum copahuensis]OAT85851.1 hypothetical protein A6M21_05075 [Desulfotomaculum copahuensis]